MLSCISPKWMSWSWDLDPKASLTLALMALCWNGYSHSSGMKKNNLLPKEIARSGLESADRNNNPWLGDSSVYRYKQKFTIRLCKRLWKTLYHPLQPWCSRNTCNVKGNVQTRAIISKIEGGIESRDCLSRDQGVLDGHPVRPRWRKLS